MSLNKEYDAAVAAVAERLRPIIADGGDSTVAARHAMSALLDHPEVLRQLLTDAAEVARHHKRSERPSSVRVTQHLGDVSPGSTIIGYQG